MFAAIAAAANAPKAEGLPQFNPEFFTSQLFWLTVTFALLYMFLSRVALPRVEDVLVERKNRISRDLTEADRLKVETDKALAAYEEQLTSAKSKAGGIAKETRERLAAETDKERAAVEAQLQRKMVEAEKRIADTKTKALASVNSIAADTAVDIVAKLTGQKISAADAAKVLS